MNIYKLIICLLSTTSFHASSPGSIPSRNQPVQAMTKPLTPDHQDSVLTQQLPIEMANRIYIAIMRNTINNLTDQEKTLIKHYRNKPVDPNQGNRSIAHLVITPEQLVRILQYAPDILTHTCTQQETPLHCYARMSDTRSLQIALDHLQKRLSPEAFTRIINLKNKSGESAFFVAASYYKWDSLKILLAHGAIPQHQNDKTTLDSLWQKREKRTQEKMHRLPADNYAYNKKQYEECLNANRKDESSALSDSPLSSNDSMDQSPKKLTHSNKDTSTGLSQINNQEPFQFSPETIETFDNLPRKIQIQHLQNLLKHLKS